MQKFTIDNLHVILADSSATRICYMLYPLDLPSTMIEGMAREFGITIAFITNMNWDDDLTPWPAPGEPPGCPSFKGHASSFLNLLKSKLLPEVERRINAPITVERTLAGVSLSGLFTLWQWMIDDTFHNIISLSGSSWYDNFVEWLKSQPLPAQTGKAYFLLGNLEAKTSVKAFRPVQSDTEEIVGYLHDKGIDVFFELVQGNHYQYGEQRLLRSLRYIYPSPSQ